MMNEAIENYLKAIYEIEQEEGKVATTALARRLEISPASATGMIKKLSDMHLVTYEPYRGVVLTENGLKIALEVIRHHRLIELFLSEALGVPWDRVHEEAEKWEHVLSEYLEDRIDELLGHPTHDPHGAPIPDRNGAVADRSQVCLSDLKTGQAATIVEVRDDNPDLLRYLGEKGLFPKANFKVLHVEPFEGPIQIQVAENQYTIGRKVAQQIYVSPANSPRSSQPKKHGGHP